jgi:hypothetical protein
MQNRPHQGFVLRARPLEFQNIPFLKPADQMQETIEAKARGRTDGPGTSPLWLALDEVYILYRAYIYTHTVLLAVDCYSC